MTDPGERLRRDYTPERQPPRMPRNIIRRPLTLVPPMIPIKDQEYEREGDDPVPTVPEFQENGDGFDALLDAIRSQDDEPEPADSSETEDPGIPFCMACGAILPDHEPTEPCPDCHGDVYDPAEPGYDGGG